MDPLYFAYGSNLSQARMTERVASARARGAASLAGFRLTLDKRSLDGSGKANLRASAADRVYGVLYEIRADQWPDLDACEPGYRRIEVEVEAAGDRLAASTYISEDLTPDPVAYEWYKRLLVEGSAEHELPAPWQARLLALPAEPDVD